MFDKKFYNCGCGWSGNALNYADTLGNGYRLVWGYKLRLSSLHLRTRQSSYYRKLCHRSRKRVGSIRGRGMGLHNLLSFAQKQGCLNQLNHRKLVASNRPIDRGNCPLHRNNVLDNLNKGNHHLPPLRHCCRRSINLSSGYNRTKFVQLNFGRWCRRERCIRRNRLPKQYIG